MGEGGYDDFNFLALHVLEGPPPGGLSEFCLPPPPPWNTLQTMVKNAWLHTESQPLIFDDICPELNYDSTIHATTPDKTS